MGREGSGIDDPAEGDETSEGVAVIVAEFLTPELAERAAPEEGEPEFFFEPWFGWRGDAELAGGGGVEPLLPMGDGGEVEEFEKAVEVAAAGLGGFCGDDGEIGAELAGEPVHFGAVV